MNVSAQEWRDSLKVARNSYKKQEYVKALKYYQSAQKKAPNDVDLSDEMGQSAYKAREFEKAEKLIDEVLLSEPKEGRYLDTKGWVLFVQGKHALAQDYFAQANLLLANDKVLIEHLGDCAIKLGQKDKAMAYWLRAKELNSTNLNLDKKIQNKAYYDPVY